MLKPAYDSFFKLAKYKKKCLAQHPEQVLTRNGSGMCGDGGEQKNLLTLKLTRTVVALSVSGVEGRSGDRGGSW